MRCSRKFFVEFEGEAKKTNQVVKDGIAIIVRGE